MTQKEKAEIKYNLLMARVTKIERVAEKIKDGVPESVACRQEDVDKNWLRNFMGKDISVKQNKAIESTPFDLKFDWFCWQDRLLGALFGEKLHVPDDFEAILEDCVNEACSEKEKTVLYSWSRDEMSLDELGKSMGVTAQRARQILSNALRKLRRKRYAFQLKYGRDYNNTLKEVHSMEEAYDRACLEENQKVYEKFLADKDVAINELKHKIEYLKKEELNKKTGVLKFIDIREVGLSPRIFHALNCAGYHNAQEIMNAGVNGLKNVRNLGPKGIEELRTCMSEKYGVDLLD